MKLSTALSLSSFALSITYIDMDADPNTGRGRDPGIAFTPDVSTGKMQRRRLKDGQGSRVPVKYVPIHALLAKQLGTNRVDVVNQAFPLLGCATQYFDRVLSISFREALAKVKTLGRKGRAVGLWEVLDMGQSVLGWGKDKLIEFVQAVEGVVGEEVVTALEVMADRVRGENDRNGTAAAGRMVLDVEPLVIQ